MIARLFARNLRHHVRLAISLGLGMVLFELLIVWIVAQIDTGPGLATLIEMFLPQEMRQLVQSQLGLASFNGGVAFGFQHPFVLVIAMAFVIVVATIPAAERESTFLELLLARPVPRARYLTAVLLLLVAGSLILPLIQLGGAAFGLAMVEVQNELPWTRYMPSATGLTTLMLAVGGYSLFIAVGCRRRGTAVAWAVGLTLASFWLDLMADLWAPLALWRWISPFNYFNPITAAMVPHTPAIDPIVLVSVFVVGGAAALFRFQRQDL